MPIVYLTPEPIRRKSGVFRDLLTSAGFTVLDSDGDGTARPAEQMRHMPDADAYIAGGEVVGDDLMALAPRLKIIARTGVGYDAIDVVAATRRGIAVSITPGANHESVAEQAFGLILGLTRNLVNNDQIIRSGGWDRTLLTPLRGKTLGLVGLGRIGRAMVPKARAFGMNVVACDPIADLPFDQTSGLSRLALEDLLAVSDVVSLHLPLNDETRAGFNGEVFARMKPGALLINTARGGLIDESDLYEALASGHLGGAGLDVLCNEPPLPDHPFFKLTNVILSPHMGGIDQKGMDDMAEMAARTVIDLFQGNWPEGTIVNPEVRGRFV